MSKPPRAVLFDFNGTINDMGVVMDQDIHVGRVEYGLELTPADIISCWGTPPEIFFTRLFGRSGTKDTWETMRRKFQAYDSAFPRRLLPGVKRTIATLREAGIVTGIVTSGQHEKVYAYMGQMGLPPEEYFDFVHTHQEIGEDIAAKRPILRKALGERAMQGKGIQPHETVFVGDEAVNMQDARSVSARFVIVASGTVSRETLLEQQVPPERLINHMGELPGYLGISQN